jgi:hypothetical protein
MPTFNFNKTKTTWYVATIEADTADEALEIASNNQDVWSIEDESEYDVNFDTKPE